MLNFWPKSTHVTVMREGRGWQWTLSDFFYNTIDSGKGLKKKSDAWTAGNAAKRKYQMELKKRIAARKKGKLKQCNQRLHKVTRQVTKAQRGKA